jgi:hypothetical protein
MISLALIFGIVKKFRKYRAEEVIEIRKGR